MLIKFRREKLHPKNLLRKPIVAPIYNLRHFGGYVIDNSGSTVVEYAYLNSDLAAVEV